MKIAITGGTGFLGQRLIELIDEANVFTRNTERADKLFAGERFAGKTIRTFKWDSNHEPAPAAGLENVDAVVHMLGETVQGRWTKEKKRRIRDSRVDGTRNLVAGLHELATRPGVLIGGSAVGYYGDRLDEILTESSTAGDDFLADVCREWEAAANAASEPGMRVVNLRTGIVLGTEGGALAAMKTPFQFCVGGRLSHGRQWFPWIHIADICELILFAIREQQIGGPLNGTAPNSVTNAEFTQQLAATLHRPAVLPAPAWLLKIVLGEFSTELLSSKRAVPEKALQAGFQFSFPSVEMALADLLG